MPFLFIDDLCLLSRPLVHLLSCVQLFATLWAAACQAVFHYLPSLLRFMSIESVMSFNHLILYCPLLLLLSVFPSIRVFSSESALHIRWPEYWSFSFSISPSSEYSGLISFRLTGLISFLSKGLSRVFSSSTAWKHQFFGAKPSLWPSWSCLFNFDGMVNCCVIYTCRLIVFLVKKFER